MLTRIGIDVGGANTDAAVVQGRADVLGWSKVATTNDCLTGVASSIQEALLNAGIGAGDVQAVMLGTTAFVNACIQRKGLARVAVLRLCGPATQALPPFCDMPPELRAVVAGYFEFVSGGYEYDGQTEISPLDCSQLAAAAAEIRRRHIPCVVVSGVFSPVRAQQEEEAGRMLAEEFGRLPGNLPPPAICLSHHIGQLGLLERENAAVLNAALLPLAARVVPQCEQAVREAGITAPLYFTGNDGTLLSSADALRMPVSTFQSGPVNSLRGAAALSGLQEGVVIDIGGTTTDVGVLVSGLPRPAPREVKFAGVATNFQMPDVFSIGLGGGSLVHWHSGSAASLAPQQAQHTSSAGRAWGAAECSAEDAGGWSEIGGLERFERCTVGPESVGNQLLERALCMGGDTPTATDVAVLLGRMTLGDEACIEQQLPPQRAQQAWASMQRQLEWCVDQAKMHAGDVPVVVVGGGAPLCGEALKGAERVIVPPHSAVANAVGAAIPQVSGSVDAVYDLATSADSRHSVLQQAEQLAKQRAVRAGALPDSCQVVLKEVLPLAYLPGNTARVQVKVIGDLSMEKALPEQHQGHLQGEQLKQWQQEQQEQPEAAGNSGPPQASISDPVGQEGSGGSRGSSREGATSTELGAEQAGPPSAEELLGAAAGHGSGSGTSRSAAAGQLGVHAGAGARRERLHMEEGGGAPEEQVFLGRGEDMSAAELAAWEPKVNDQGEWVLQEQDLHLLTIGTGILGTGGGGSPGKAKLKALMELQRAGPGSMRVVRPAALPPEGLIVDGGFMGAPTVGLEKLDSDQAEAAVQAVMSAYAASQPGGAGAAQPCLVALLAGEVGGGNGIEPLSVGSRLGLPVVDGDLMGRAFPELQMMTSAIYGLPIAPAALADEKGNSVVVQSVHSAEWLERLLRPLCTEMGCSAGFASRPLTAEQLRQVLVPHSLSLAWRLGHAVVSAQASKGDPGVAIATEAGGKVLFRGKVMEVDRSTTGGFARGSLTLRSLPLPPSSRSSSNSSGDEGTCAAAPASAAAEACARGQQEQQEQHEELKIEFQNENLLAVADGRCMASVPDLICCVEAESGLPISTEEMRYGLRVAVVGIPAHPLLTTAPGQAVVGPAAFGYSAVQYCPLGMYIATQPIPRSGAPA